MRASSWNRISTGVPLGRSAGWAFSVRAKFFVSLDDFAVLRRVARPGAHMRKAEFLHERPHMALMVVDAEALPDDALQIDPPPAHHAVDGPVRPGLHDLRQFRLLPGRLPRVIAAVPMVLQTIGTFCIETMHPVPQRLPVHAADPCRIRPAHPVQDRRQ
jgi:hypothetical protein